MRTEFVIEGTFEGGDGRGYVLARAVDPTITFTVSSETKLGGCAVERWLDIPRAMDAAGNQRTDLFGFCLRNVSDRTHLEIGARVVLA